MKACKVNVGWHEARAKLIEEALRKIVKLAEIPDCDHLATTPGFKAAIANARDALADEGKP